MKSIRSEETTRVDRNDPLIATVYTPLIEHILLPQESHQIHVIHRVQTIVTHDQITSIIAIHDPSIIIIARCDKHFRRKTKLRGDMNPDLLRDHGRSNVETLTLLTGEARPETTKPGNGADIVNTRVTK